MSPVSISESRPFTIASGEPRHRMNTNAVKLASGDILVFYRDGSDHWRTFDSAVMMVRSKDEGETWSAPEHVFSEPGYGSSAHHGAEQLSDGRLILPVTLIGEILRSPMGETNVKDSRKAKVYVLTSEDDGNSWSEPVQVGPMEGWYWQNQYGRVRELPDGRVFVPGGGQKNGEEAWYSGYFVSHDGGRTFPDRIEIAHGLADELDLALLPDGRWIAMVRDLPRASISRLSPEEREQTFFYLHQSYSKDEGRTWSEPVSSGVLGHCPSFLVLPSDTILLGHRQVDPKRTAGCALSASTDGGATWEHIKDIYVAPNGIWDCAYPTMVLLEDGRVFCAYYTEFFDGNSTIEGITFEVNE